MRNHANKQTNASEKKTTFLVEVTTEETYCNVDSFGISSSLCALDDLNVEDTGDDVAGFKPTSLGLGLCVDRPAKAITGI